MQNDGNLVLYRGGTALWDSATNNSAADKASMGSDGDLALYTSSGTVLWDSGTSGNSGAYVLVQNDGNLVIRSASGSALWDTATNGR